MIVCSLLLRRALAADALASGAMALAMSLAARPLASLLHLPEALVLDAGLFLIPYAALVGWMASRTALLRGWVVFVIAGNAAWTLASAALLASQNVAPNALGFTFVVAQAVAVGVFAELQFVGLRRSHRTFEA